MDTYKKKYEAALELASQYYVGLANCRAKDELEKIFPELRESKDERMIKAILSAIRGGLDTEKFLEKHGTNYEEVETYLEKQKDASKAIEAVDRIDKYIDQYAANAHDMKDSNPNKKYYLGWDGALGKIAGILQDVYSGEKQKKQKED